MPSSSAWHGCDSKQNTPFGRAPPFHFIFTHTHTQMYLHITSVFIFYFVTCVHWCTYLIGSPQYGHWMMYISGKGLKESKARAIMGKWELGKSLTYIKINNYSLISFATMFMQLLSKNGVLLFIWHGFNTNPHFFCTFISFFSNLIFPFQVYHM